VNLQRDPSASSVQYRAYGLVLATDAPLPELTPIASAPSAAQADVRIRFLGPRQEFFSPSPCFMSWTLPTGDLWLSCAKDERGFFLRFPELADFFIDSSGGEIVCYAGRETPPLTTSHLLLNQVLPLVLNLRGADALHATAVLTARGVCAFAGPAGAGKSTLAADFLRAGYPVLSDDCLVLEENAGEILAVPAYPGLRLWDDAFDALGADLSVSRPVAHYSSKKCLVPEDPLDFPTALHPVTRIYSLVRSQENEGSAGPASPLIEYLSPRDAFMELMQIVFRLDINDRSMLVRQFHLLDRVVSRIAVRRLRIPNAFSSLPEVRAAILSDLADCD
jgi:hypothetical protein